MFIAWSEEEIEKFQAVESELIFLDKDGEEDIEWLNHFLNCDFKESWEQDKLIEALKVDKEAKFLIEQVFEKYLQ